MADLNLSGAFTALVTPFSEDTTKLDLGDLEKLVEAQIGAGISGLVPCGTTGETPTLSQQEQLEVIRTTARVAAGRVPVLAGTGSNSTQKTIEASEAALEAGADAVMIAMPYYNKPSQAGLFRHIELVAKALQAPVVLYNIPARSAVKLNVETTLDVLDACPNVVGIKDASGGLSYSQELLSRASARVSLASGDDALTLPMMAVGASGVISVTSNLYPRAISELVAALRANDWQRGRALHFRLLPVHREVFSEPSPAPIKAALALSGAVRAGVRSPIIEATPECRKRLELAMQGLEA
jgi:4-hydroxy-tetrahydrodipicolinate synthase